MKRSRGLGSKVMDEYVSAPIEFTFSACLNKELSSTKPKGNEWKIVAGEEDYEETFSASAKFLMSNMPSFSAFFHRAFSYYDEFRFG